MFHMRTVLGFDAADKPNDTSVYMVATSEEMLEARKIWVKGVTKASHLKTVKISALVGLCGDVGIDIHARGNGDRLRRKEIVALLLVSLPPVVAFPS